MLKSLRNIFLFVISATSLSLFGQTVAVPWTGTPGEVEAAVAANGGAGTFQLEDGKVQSSRNRLVVMGRDPIDGLARASWKLCIEPCGIVIRARDTWEQETEPRKWCIEPWREVW